MLLFHRVGPVPSDLGVSNGKLSPCPGPAHCAEAIWPSDNPQTDLSRIASVLRDQARTVVVQQTENYLHAEVSSRFFGFVDDLELQTQNQALQARSISRLGDSDLGVNARRLDLIQTSLN